MADFAQTSFDPAMVQPVRRAPKFTIGGLGARSESTSIGGFVPMTTTIATTANPSTYVSASSLANPAKK